MLRILAVLLVAAFATSSAFAEVYKCKGSQGRVTYQDTPCGAGVVEKVIEIVDDRAYNPPLSAEMQKAAEELRKKNRELAERLNNESKERQAREAERRASEEQRARYQPPSVAAVDYYDGGTYRSGYFFNPYFTPRRHAMFPGHGWGHGPGFLPPAHCLGPIGWHCGNLETPAPPFFNHDPRKPMPH